MSKFLSKFALLSLIVGTSINLIIFISYKEFKGKIDLLYETAFFISFFFMGIFVLVSLGELLTKKKLFKKKKAIKYISIALSIHIFAVLSPLMPSINRYDEPALQTLKENLNKAYIDASYLNHANKFNALKSEYSDKSHSIGYTHFKVGENENLKYNFSLLERGDFKNEDMQMTIVDIKNPNEKNSDTFFTAKNVSDIDNNKYVTLDYFDSINIQNSTSISLSIDVFTQTKKCFILLLEQHKEKNKPSIAPIKKDFCLAENEKNTKITRIEQYSISPDTRYLKFSLVPSELENNYLEINPWAYLKNDNVDKSSPTETNEKNLWSISDMNLSMDKSGLARDIPNLCIEGYHEAAPEYTFSIQEKKFSKKNCAQRDL